jgi:DNA-binding NarL/FixJ family response regulator
MAPVILLVDDQRDILLLLHSALDTLRNPDLEILEAASSEAALEALGNNNVNLLVTDYNLPGLNGVQLMHQARAGQPDLRVIMVTGNTDRNLRDEMLNAGALAVFRKPVPLGDFLDAVERGLGVARTMLPTESEQQPEATHIRVSELLANFRQDLGADAVFLVSYRGRIAERAGDLRDGSMELSLMSALTASFSAGLKVAESNRQESLSQFSVFSGGDQDLILMPVNPAYALLLAGKNMADADALPRALKAMTAVKEQAAKSLQQIAAASKPARKQEAAEAAAPDATDIEALLDSVPESGMTQAEMDAYWDAAASQHANKPLSDDMIPYEEARKRGLTPGSGEE